MKRKLPPIQEKIAGIEKTLVNALAYLQRGVNVESSSFLHFRDWKGHSGHPLWVQNHMIPVLLRSRTRQEEKMRTLEDRAKDKRLSLRKQRGRKRRLID
jgi:hypothetical protein